MLSLSKHERKRARNMSLRGAPPSAALRTGFDKLRVNGT